MSWWHLVPESGSSTERGDKVVSRLEILRSETLGIMVRYRNLANTARMDIST